MSRESWTPRTVSFFMPSFRGGGAERVLLMLAQGMAAQGETVDLLVAQTQGPYRAQVPPGVRVVDLKAKRVLAALPGLAGYLRRARPHALLSALPHANVVSVWARSLSGAHTRLVLSEHTVASLSAQHSNLRRARVLPLFMRRAYPRADAVVVVSEGAADDLAALLRLDRRRITRIYNPVVTPRLFELAAESLDHPWFADGAAPVVLGTGRLTPGKDFATLLRAFTLVRRERDARLVILGEGQERQNLESLARQLGIATDVELPGFVDNPYRYMSRAHLFVLASRWEGFGNVLVEAMACGAPVVSTDCPTGPREILDDGRFGRLTPVGDVESMAAAIVAGLEAPRRMEAVERARQFTLASALDAYRAALAI